MTDAVTKEPTAEEIWNEEAAKRNTTATTAAVEAKTSIDTPAPVEAAPEGTPDQASAEAVTGTETPPAEPAPPSDTDLLQQILSKMDKLEGRTRNVEGHIGGLKNAQQQLHAAMEAARKQTGSDESPTQKQVAQAFSNPQKWEELKKDFPEWAEATEELLGARLASVNSAGSPDTFEKLINERVQEATQSLRQEIVDSALDAVLPGWKKVVKTPEFHHWMSSQPEDVQALAQSDAVGDAARMLRLFDSARSADPSVQIRENRKQKLANATALPKGGTVPKAKTVADMTPEELWNYEAEQREKQRAERGF